MTSKKTFSTKEYLQFIAVILTVLLIIIVAVGEVVIRVVTTPSEYSNKSVINDNVGWAPKQDYAELYNVSNYGDKKTPYVVNYRTL